MSIFDKIKSTLGLQKQNSKQSAGHRLGGNDLVVDNEQDILTDFPYEYDVEFKEEGNLFNQLTHKPTSLLIRSVNRITRINSE